jgi:hypothetical protein
VICSVIGKPTSTTGTTLLAQHKICGQIILLQCPGFRQLGNLQDYPWQEGLNAAWARPHSQWEAQQREIEREVASRLPSEKELEAGAHVPPAMTSEHDTRKPMHAPPRPPPYPGPSALPCSQAGMKLLEVINKCRGGNARATMAETAEATAHLAGLAAWATPTEKRATPTTQRATPTAKRRKVDSEGTVEANGASSAHRGVYWHQPRGQWLAQICVNGADRHLGYFNDEAEAALAVVAAEREAIAAMAQVPPRPKVMPEDEGTGGALPGEAYEDVVAAEAQCGQGMRGQRQLHGGGGGEGGSPRRGECCVQEFPAIAAQSGVDSQTRYLGTFAEQYVGIRARIQEGIREDIHAYEKDTETLAQEQRRAARAQGHEGAKARQQQLQREKRLRREGQQEAAGRFFIDTPSMLAIYP